MSPGEDEAQMIQSHNHFRKSIAAEAMRLMDEEPLSLDQAFEKAKQAFANVPGYEAPERNDNLAVSRPAATD